MSYIVEKRPPLLSGDGKWRFVYSDPSRYTRVHARYLASIKNLPPFWEIRLRQDNQVLETYVRPTRSRRRGRHEVGRRDPRSRPAARRR